MGLRAGRIPQLPLSICRDRAAELQGLGSLEALGAAEDSLRTRPTPVLHQNTLRKLPFSLHRDQVSYWTVAAETSASYLEGSGCHTGDGTFS